MTESWFALPTAKVLHDEISVELRAWSPGDGLACRGAASAKRRIPCGAPVAVVRSTKAADRYGRPERTTIALYCEHHVSELVRRQLGEADWRGNPSTQETIKRAQETVLAAHWGEYQDALNAIITEQRERYLSALPDWLRAGFEAAEDAAS